MWTAPTVSEFKAFFIRDFPYAPEAEPDNLSYVVNNDISRAITEGQIPFNSDLFGDNATSIFMYLAAHFLAVNLQNAQKGIQGQARFPALSKSVGSVSVSNALPEKFVNNPLFSGYLKTSYGQKYLELAYPYTIGRAKLIRGATTFA
jgi:hypothetical protein